jgi:cytochrome c-type biogenesis protein CcmH/NrfF
MKAEIRAWVTEGKTDREILDTYIQRYGKRVLVEPEGAAWWWMHVIPWVFLAAGLGLLIPILRRMRAVRNAPAVPVPAGPLPAFEDDEEAYSAGGQNGQNEPGRNPGKLR